jgi:hypothetical protein
MDVGTVRRKVGTGGDSISPESCRLPQHRRRHLTSLLVVVTTLALIGCGQSAQTPSGQPPPSPKIGNDPGIVPPATASPTADATGFAFEVDAVIGYYESQGYACTAVQASTTAAGYSYRSCQTQDTDGRTHVIGLVSDVDGALANGFASVQGNAQETVLAPIDALDPLAGFLGAMLGEDRGAALLMWLAGHLGDAYAETTSGALRVATYRESESDFSKLYVEIANQAYLDAPGVTRP